MNGPSASDAASQAASRPRHSTARRINYDEGPDEDLQMSPALELTTSAPKEPAAPTAEAPSAPAAAAMLTAHLPAVKSGAAKASSKKGKKTKAEDQEYTEDAAAQKTGTAGSKAGRAASKKAAAQPDALPAPTEEQNNLPLSLLERLPFPAWDSILPHLQRDPVSMMRLSLTCRTIYGVVFRNEKVWKERCLATGRQKRVSRHDTWRETYWKLWSSRCINCSQPSGAKMKTPENESIIPGAPPHLVQCTDCQGKKGPYQVISKGRALAAGASKDFLDELPAKFLHNGYGSYGVSNWITQYLRSSIPECVDHTIPKWRSGPNIERCLALFGHADGRAELERILKMASSSTKVAQPTELQTFAREIVETQQTPTETLQEFIDYYSSLRTMLRKVDAALVKAKAPPEAVALLSLSDVAPNNLTDGASWIELLVEDEPVTTVKAYVKDLEKRGAAIIKQREEEAARVAEAARQAAIREEQRLAARAKADADRKARDEKLLADRLAREAALDQLNAERIARGEDAVHQPGSGGCHSGIACSNASARECANGMCGPCCASRARPCSRHVNRAFVAQQSNQATVVQEVQQVEEMPSPQAMQIDNQTLPTIPSQPQQQRDGDEAPLQPALPPFILSQQDAKASGADGSVSASLSLPDNTFDSGFVLPEGAIDAGSSLPGPSRLLARLETETMSSMYGAKRPADALADSTGARSGPSTPSKRARTDETILAPLSNGALIDNSIETTQEQHF